MTDQIKPLQKSRLEQPYDTLTSQVSKTLNNWSAKQFYKELSVPHHFLAQLFIIEDKRFILHPGIDPIAIIRATLVNTGSKKVYEGASTITQQLYNVYQEKSGNVYKRRIIDKLKQASWALKTDASWSKSKILSEYLENVYWGRHYYGIDEATSGYFKSKRQDITIAQSFFLAERIALPNIVDTQRIIVLLNQPMISSIFLQNPSYFNQLIEIYEEKFQCGDKLCQFLAK